MRIAHGSPDTLKARCGWQYVIAVLIWSATLPDDYNNLCEKCFYKERLTLKVQQAVHAVSWSV